MNIDLYLPNQDLQTGKVSFTGQLLTLLQHPGPNYFPHSRKQVIAFTCCRLPRLILSDMTYHLGNSKKPCFFILEMAETAALKGKDTKIFVIFYHLQNSCSRFQLDISHRELMRWVLQIQLCTLAHVLSLIRKAGGTKLCRISVCPSFPLRIIKTWLHWSSIDIHTHFSCLFQSYTGWCSWGWFSEQQTGN